LLHRSSRMPAPALRPVTTLAKSAVAGDGAWQSREVHHSHSKNPSGNARYA
jgi:hypothetical protein